jgi:hypothetical protein
MPESRSDSDTPAEEEPAIEQSEAEQPETFANRAARRAKGKTSANPGVSSKGQRPVGRGAVQSPRQYGNRRSG